MATQYASDNEPIQLVWFKRDLRVSDHGPLTEAAARGPVLPLYIVEPALIHAPDFAPAHWSFIADCLRALRAALARRGQPLIVRVGEPVAVLEHLAATLPIAQLWAHEETGNLLSYQRDRAVRRWARARGLPFTELPQGGVVRRLASRDIWDASYDERMARPLFAPPPALRPLTPALDPGPIPSHAELGLAPDRLASGRRREPGPRAARRFPALARGSLPPGALQPAHGLGGLLAPQPLPELGSAIG